MSFPSNDRHAMGEDVLHGQFGFAVLKTHVVRNKIKIAMWFTRCLTIIYTISYLIEVHGPHSLSMYNKTLISSAATYALRLHQRCRRMTFSRELLSTIILEDSFHYIMYSFIFLYITPFAFPLIPLFYLSLVCNVYYTCTLLCMLGTNLWTFTAPLISIVQNQFSNILKIIAYIEILLIPFTILLPFMGHASLGTPFYYHHFLILRYLSRRNPSTRDAFHEIRVALETLANKPQTPYLISKIILFSIVCVCRLCPQGRFYTGANAQ